MNRFVLGFIALALSGVLSNLAQADTASPPSSLLLAQSPTGTRQQSLQQPDSPGQSQQHARHATQRAGHSRAEHSARAAPADA